jgi:hypothetical protein
MLISEESNLERYILLPVRHFKQDTDNRKRDFHLLGLIPPGKHHCAYAYLYTSVVYQSALAVSTDVFWLCKGKK